MITAADFVREARSLVGVPWVHLGRTRHGVDCIGLIVLAAKNAGLDVFEESGCPRISRYGRKPDPKLYELVARHCERATSPVPGSVALFRFHGEKHSRHFGVITFDDTMIHAEAKSRQCVVEHGYRMQWLRWTDSLWKIPGVSYE